MHHALIKTQHAPQDIFALAKAAPQQPLARQENMEMPLDKRHKQGHARTRVLQVHTVTCLEKQTFLLRVLFALQGRIAMEMVP